MPVSIDLRRMIEEDTRLIEAGEESYGSLAERHGVPKSTVYRIHTKRLEREAENAKRRLSGLDEKIAGRLEDFKGLEEKYRRKGRISSRVA